MGLKLLEHVMKVSEHVLESLIPSKLTLITWSCFMTGLSTADAILTQETLY